MKKVFNFYLEHIVIFAILSSISCAGSICLPFIFYPIENGLLLIPSGIKVLSIGGFIIGASMTFCAIGIIGLEQERKRLCL